MPEPLSARPTVTVRGEAQLEGPPDLATFTFTAHRAGETQDVVRSGLAEASGQVHQLLNSFEGALERSSTTGLHVVPIFGRRAQTKIQGFRGTFSTEVVVRDFDALSAIVLALAPVVDSQIDGPYWSLRPDNPMYRDVRLAAIAEARQRADDYAAAFGGVVLDLVEISDLEAGFAQTRAMRASAYAMGMGAENAPDFEFEPAIQTVSGQVTVQFTMSAPDLSLS
jgi:uncharacterized protein YggE